MRVVPVQAVPQWAGCDTDLPSTVSRRWFALPCYSTVCGFPPSDSAESKTVTIHLGAPMPWIIKPPRGMVCWRLQHLTRGAGDAKA